MADRNVTGNLLLTISRADARAAGLKKYFTGKQCLRTHLSERYVRNGHCLMCQIEQQRIWTSENRQRSRDKRRAWVLANPEKEKQAAKRHRDANLEKRRASVRACYKAHPEKWKAHSKTRKALKLKRMPAWADFSKIKEIYEKCPKGYHVDHVYPLRGKTVSGLHVEYNLQYLPAVENLRKRNRMPELARRVDFGSS